MVCFLPVWKIGTDLDSTKKFLERSHLYLSHLKQPLSYVPILFLYDKAYNCLRAPLGILFVWTTPDFLLLVFTILCLLFFGIFCRLLINRNFFGPFRSLFSWNLPCTVIYNLSRERCILNWILLMWVLRSVDLLLYTQGLGYLIAYLFHEPIAWSVFIMLLNSGIMLPVTETLSVFQVQQILEVTLI